jgi:hypothetical protein
MTMSALSDREFDAYHNQSARHERALTIASNDAFTAAMLKAINKGRETAVPGTHIDHTPYFGKRLYGTFAMSSCGSPAAMCLEVGAAASGAETMK